MEEDVECFGSLLTAILKILINYFKNVFVSFCYNYQYKNLFIKGNIMHTMKLQVNESIYSQVLSFINQFQTNELNLVEDTTQEDYIVSSVEEVQRRVLEAEANGNYISADKFFSDMDKKIEAL